ncbi:hypothetical protein HMPREF0058_0864 [Actinomyces urogenitalis DSM 15434]|uniref:Uncharacterized protein n=1 Tax=Actinomyces urogenitalis DSM 15434 TaxID=525246 RepID=C0W4S0_9ACTO|nr:hypothetical protein HMPREF0058_0864 [Actinomyces urogenitalis DSM 15434]
MARALVSRTNPIPGAISSRRPLPHPARRRPLLPVATFSSPSPPPLAHQPRRHSYLSPTIAIPRRRPPPHHDHRPPIARPKPTPAATHCPPSPPPSDHRYLFASSATP